MSKPLNAQDAIFYGSFVQAAYAMFLADDTNLRPDPAGRGVPDGWDVVAWITMKDFFLFRSFEKFYGILAEKRDSPSSYVLAIRGTEEAIEWFDDANAFLVPFDHVQGAGFVHKGFMTIYDTIKVTPREPARAVERAAPNAPAAATVLAQPTGSFADQIAQVVSRRSAAGRPTQAVAEGVSLAGAEVVVAGHSLGAALATLYVVENTKKHAIANPLVCTFASPRVGDQTFVDTFNGFGLTSWRIENVPDWAPDLPPDVWGYRHVDAVTLVDSSAAVQPTLACSHAITTYFHMLDPAQPVRPECVLTEEEARRLREQLPDPATADQEVNATSGVHSGDA
jgi:hypothetical protein